MRTLKFNGLHHPQFSKISVFHVSRTHKLSTKKPFRTGKFSFSEWLAETLISGNLVQIFLFLGLVSAASAAIVSAAATVSAAVTTTAVVVAVKRSSFTFWFRF